MVLRDSSIERKELIILLGCSSIVEKELLMFTCSSSIVRKELFTCPDVLGSGYPREGALHYSDEEMGNGGKRRKVRKSKRHTSNDGASESIASIYK
jgi:hypothetical protein